MINAGTVLSSGGVTGAVSLTLSNAVGTVGPFAVSGTGNGFTLTDAADRNLAVSGTLTAPGDIGLTTSGTGTITVAGSIGATSGTLSLSSGSGGIGLRSGASLTAGFISLYGGAGAISLSGNALLGQSGATIDLTTDGGVSETGTSSIIAGTLESLGGLGGDGHSPTAIRSPPWAAWWSPAATSR